MALPIWFFSAAHQAANADDLASAYIERDISKTRLLTGDPDEGQRRLLRPQWDIGIEAFQRPANHIADETFIRHLIDSILRHKPPVSQNRDAIAESPNLLESMGDIQDRPSLRLQPPHDGEEDVGFFVGEGRRWLVQDQSAGCPAQCPHDLQQLLFGPAEVFHPRINIEGYAEIGEDLDNVISHLGLFEKASAGHFSAQKVILSHCH